MRDGSKMLSSFLIIVLLVLVFASCSQRQSEAVLNQVGPKEIDSEIRILAGEEVVQYFIYDQEESNDAK